MQRQLSASPMSYAEYPILFAPNAWRRATLGVMLCGRGLRTTHIHRPLTTYFSAAQISIIILNSPKVKFLHSFLCGFKKSSIYEIPITLHSNLLECRCAKGLSKVQSPLSPTLTLTSPYTEDSKQKVPVRHYKLAINAINTSHQSDGHGLPVCSLRNQSSLTTEKQLYVKASFIASSS